MKVNPKLKRDPTVAALLAELKRLRMIEGEFTILTRDIKLWKAVKRIEVEAANLEAKGFHRALLRERIETSRLNRELSVMTKARNQLLKERPFVYARDRNTTTQASGDREFDL